MSPEEAFAALTPEQQRVALERVNRAKGIASALARTLSEHGAAQELPTVATAMVLLLSKVAGMTEDPAGMLDLVMTMATAQVQADQADRARQALH